MRFIQTAAFLSITSILCSCNSDGNGGKLGGVDTSQPGKSQGSELPPEGTIATLPTEINGSYLTGAFEAPAGAPGDTISGAAIIVRGHPELAATTDANGRFKFAVPPGGYTLYAVS